jgi:hypothetical protein
MTELSMPATNPKQKKRERHISSIDMRKTTTNKQEKEQKRHTTTVSGQTKKQTNQQTRNRPDK